MTMGLKACILILAATYPTCLSAAANKWPPIQPLEERIVVANLGKEGADSPLVTFINDLGGRPAYKLECHNGGHESEISFSGDFQCGLFAVRGTALTSGNLLAAETKNELSTDWWNRGRVRSVQLRGECLRYPEYSTDRRFRLRRMLVSIRIADIRWSALMDRGGDPMLAGFALDVSVKPEEAATSSRSELVPGPRPPSSCYP